jgi:hypothetical protein
MLTMRTPYWMTAALMALALVAVAPQHAAADKINQSFLGGVAIDGYDPVAYFTDGKPVEGTSDITADWQDATWRFASTDHRALFVANPEKYAPAYGGYCAWAVSQGYTASIDPTAWRIVDGRLYLNYSQSVQQQWAEDVPGNIQKADGNWVEIEKDL